MQLQSGTEPGALIRTPLGRITFWSEELERRYGFSAKQAVGQISHELLRANHLQTRSEIAAVLATRSEWRGGLIAYHADDQPLIVANHWYLHGGANGRGSFVTEIHSDIVMPGTAPGEEMADVVTILAGDLSQPLTALGGSIEGMQRAAQSDRADHRLVDRRLSKAATQLERASSMVARVRAIGETLRTPRLHELHARLAEAVDQSERLFRKAQDVQATGAAVQESSAAVRQRTRAAREERHRVNEAGVLAVERALALQSIQVYRRRLDALRSEPPNSQAERLLTQLLIEEEAKLASLDQAVVPRE